MVSFGLLDGDLQESGSEGRRRKPSWASQDDPKEGNFTFQRDQAGDASKYKVMQNQHPYWKSGVYGKFIQANEMFDFISFLLSNFTMTATSLPAQTSNNYSNGWLVMNYDGHIQYFMQGDGLKPVWSQPRASAACSCVQQVPEVQ
ncbi:hypothetical protein NL676_017554 [Syzygium grande]|nr:hypothetical protein NL676_017554 [Syzygium grande]